MTGVTEEIIDWLHRQPDWLQEAAERLLGSGTLGDEDAQAIAERLKTSDGQKITDHRTFDGLGGTSDSAEELHLVSIGDIKGIENLAPRNPLTFGNGNFAQIYGPNGSGKSGYTRIIKRACGHPRAVELKPNVFQPPPGERRCKIAFSIAGTEKSITWCPDSDAIEELRSVDVFDSEVADFYLTREKEPSYTPPQIALFEELASVCDRIKSVLQLEQDSLKSCLPMLPTEYEHTPAAKLYHSLNAKMAEQEIARLTQWTDDDQKALDELTERLNTADPALHARKARQQKAQVERLAEQLRVATSAASLERLQAIRHLRETAKTKRRIATEAGKIKSAHLDGVGSDTWNALWEAARAYSQVPYPDKEYPVTEEGARCVLCHQKLSLDAQQRLRDFESFVQGTVEKDAKRAEEEYRKALANLPKVPDGEALQVHCEAAGLDEGGWFGKLGEFWKNVGHACDRLREDEENGDAVALQSPENLLQELKEKAEALEKNVARYNEDAKHFDREEADKEKRNLETKRWIAQQGEAIKSEIERLKKLSQYKEWKKQANSRPISIKAGELAEKIITQAYVNRFNEELKRLGAHRIKVEIVKTRTQQGVALHQLILKNVMLTEASPDVVLSDGERRVVSLSAFLADVAEKPYPAPFVFDDPISSLDDEFEWFVALRLAKLANERQVLVFTHRLSLYGMIGEAAKKFGESWRKENLVQGCIESYGGAVGHPADESFWNANTKKANNILLDRLDRARKAGEAGGGDAYREIAQGICTDFRKLLEKTIEDDLLNQTIRRHRRSVQTENKLGGLPCITTEDCKFIDTLMTKYSAFEHSQSPETPATIPDEPELRTDIESLKAWREEFKKRPMEAVV